MKVRAEILKSFCQAAFERLGLSREDAALTAENLVWASLRGVDSHGVMRMKIYADRLRAGGTDAKAKPRVVREEDALVVLDAGHGVGQVAGAEGMRRAIAKAQRAGLGLCGVRHSNHFGAAAFFAMMALEHGMIGLAFSNATPTMAPSGGREARVGNNPISLAVPAGCQPPLVLDMASGAVAKDKIYVAQQEGKKIPLTWALDSEGLPTDDPDKAARGLIQPSGGYKGYGISLMIDVLTGVLMGGGFSTLVGQMYGTVEKPTSTAHTFAALRVDRFQPLDEFGSRVDQLIELMRSCPRAAGAGRIYVPGEIERETEERRRAEGIPLAAPLVAELRALAEELDLPAGF